VGGKLEWHRPEVSAVEPELPWAQPHPPLVSKLHWTASILDQLLCASSWQQHTYPLPRDDEKPCLTLTLLNFFCIAVQSPW
jgi:hypothetical protein